MSICRPFNELSNHDLILTTTLSRSCFFQFGKDAHEDRLEEDDDEDDDEEDDDEEEEDGEENDEGNFVCSLFMYFLLSSIRDDDDDDDDDDNDNDNDNNNDDNNNNDDADSDCR